MSENHLILGGRLTRKTSPKYTPGGLAVSEFIIAVPSESDELKTDYLKVLLHGPIAETSSDFKIGDELLITGHVRMRTFIDKQNQPTEKLEILVDKIKTLHKEE